MTTAEFRSICAFRLRCCCLARAVAGDSAATSTAVAPAVAADSADAASPAVTSPASACCSGGVARSIMPSDAAATTSTLDPYSTRLGLYVGALASTAATDYSDPVRSDAVRPTFATDSVNDASHAATSTASACCSGGVVRHSPSSSTAASAVDRGPAVALDPYSTWLHYSTWLDPNSTRLLANPVTAVPTDAVADSAELRDPGSEAKASDDANAELNGSRRRRLREQLLGSKCRRPRNVELQQRLGKRLRGS